MGLTLPGELYLFQGMVPRSLLAPRAFLEFYELSTENEWKVLDNEMIETATHSSEECTSISDNGSRIIIGDQSAYDRWGKITVYDYLPNEDGGTWTEILEVKGEVEGDHVGWGTCSLSGDGSTLVSVGLHMQHTPNESKVQKVRIFRVDSSPTDWKQIGGDVFGPSWWETNRANMFGTRDTPAAISFDGNVVAIGAIDANVYNRHPRSGIIRVYKYNATKDIWMRVGSDIWGASMLDGKFGKGLSSETSRNIYVYENVSNIFVTMNLQVIVICSSHI